MTFGRYVRVTLSKIYLGIGVTIWKASVMEYHRGFASWVTRDAKPQWNLQHACDRILNDC